MTIFSSCILHIRLRVVSYECNFLVAPSPCRYPVDLLQARQGYLHSSLRLPSFLHWMNASGGMPSLALSNAAKASAGTKLTCSKHIKEY
jgi:hypothetical protein